MFTKKITLTTSAQNLRTVLEAAGYKQDQKKAIEGFVMRLAKGQIKNISSSATVKIISSYDDTPVTADGFSIEPGNYLNFDQELVADSTYLVSDGTSDIILTIGLQNNGSTLSSLAQSSLDAKQDKTKGVNLQTGTTYTFLASDVGKIVKLTNASGITATVPSGLGAGFHCKVIQGGAGQVTFAGSGATVPNRSTHTKIAGQNGVVSLESAVADAVHLSGDTAA